MTTGNKYGLRVAGMALLTVFLCMGSATAQDGAAIFNQNCAVCHKIGGGKFIGPDLQGVGDRRTEEWLVGFIKNSQALINGGDADAQALFKEYNNTPMPAFPLSDAQIKAVLTHIASAGPAASAGGAQGGTSQAAPVEEPEFTAEDVEAGKLLFTGSSKLENRGPSCASCHNVNNEDVAGGLMAKDLTMAYERLGGGVSIMGLLSAAPFPAMAAAYGDKPLTEQEVKQLTAFLKDAKSAGVDGTGAAGNKVFYAYGIIILLVLLIIIQLLWAKRSSGTIRKNIFERQITTN